MTVKRGTSELGSQGTSRKDRLDPDMLIFAGATSIVSREDSGSVVRVCRISPLLRARRADVWEARCTSDRIADGSLAERVT